MSKPKTHFVGLRLIVKHVDMFVLFVNFVHFCEVTLL